MKKEVIIKKSSRDDKKYDAIIDGNKTVSFGAKGYSDFTKHKDEERKKKYIARHGAKAAIKTGKIIQNLQCGLKIFYGINQQ